MTKQLVVSLMQHGSDDLKRGSVAMKRSMFKQSYALDSASRAAQWSHAPSCFFFFLFFFCCMIYSFLKKKKKTKQVKKAFENPRGGRGLTLKMCAHKHVGRAQVRGQMALNSLPLDWGHQRSLCVLLSIYFTHHPSSGQGDPVTLELGLPVRWLSIHEHGGLTLGQHLFSQEGGRKEGVCCSVI